MYDVFELRDQDYDGNIVIEGMKFIVVVITIKAGVEYL